MDRVEFLCGLIKRGDDIIASKIDMSGPGSLLSDWVDADEFQKWTADSLAFLDTFPKGSVDRQIREIEVNKTIAQTLTLKEYALNL